MVKAEEVVVIVPKTSESQPVFITMILSIVVLFFTMVSRFKQAYLLMLVSLTPSSSRFTVIGTIESTGSLDEMNPS